MSYETHISRCYKHAVKIILQAALCLCCLCYWFCTCNLDIYHPEAVQTFWELHVSSVWLHKGCGAGMKLPLQIKESWCGTMDFSRESFKETATHTPFRAERAPANDFYMRLQRSPLNMVNNATSKVKPGLYWGIHKSSEEMNTCPNVLNAGRQKPSQTTTRLRGMPPKNGRISHQPDNSEAAETRLLNSWSVGRGRCSHRTP